METYEQLSLPKGKIQRSNWEARLSQVQQDCMSEADFSMTGNLTLKIDAANDAHSGFIIYSRFTAMAQIMPSAPKSVYYSFDAINGRLLDSSGVPWSPSNPEYDPGPPPPPKPPKPPRAPKSATDSAAVMAPLPVSTQAKRPTPRARTSFDKSGNYSFSNRRPYLPVDDSLLPLRNGTEQSSRTRRSYGSRRRGGSAAYGQGPSV